MITNEKHLLYILSVNKEQLNYLLTHLEDYYCSFEKVKINKFTGKPKKNSNGKIVTRQINLSKGKLKEVQARLFNFMVKQVEIPQYVCGGEAVIKTLYGNVICKIKEGTQSGSKIRLRGKGMPLMKNPSQKGDQYAVVQIQVPKNVSQQAKNKLKEFEALCGQRGNASY